MFDRNKYKNNKSDTKQRMAGDYLSEFTQKFSDNSQQNEVKNKKDFNTFKGDDGKSYGTNTEKMLFGNSRTTSEPSASGTVTEDAKSVKTPNTSGGFKLGKAQQEIYDQNLKIIGNYNGKNGRNSTANGAAYNADLMSGINYDRAVKQNAKFDASMATQNSIASGADHGSGKYKAPQTKDYYDYLKSYSGPKSWDDVIAANDSPEVQMGLDKSKPRTSDTYTKWVKDTENYNKAWG